MLVILNDLLIILGELFYSPFFMKPNIENSWLNLLYNEFEKEYFSSLMDFLINEYDNHIIYPPKKIIFNAFNICNFKFICALARAFNCCFKVI